MSVVRISYTVGVLQGLDPALTPIIRAILSKLVAQKDQGLCNVHDILLGLSQIGGHIFKPIKHLNGYYKNDARIIACLAYMLLQ